MAVRTCAGVAARHAVLALLWAASTAFGAAIAAEPAAAADPDVDPDTLIVRFRNDVPSARRAATHRAGGGRVMRHFDLVPIDVVRIPAGGDRAAIAAAY